MLIQLSYCCRELADIELRYCSCSAATLLCSIKQQLGDTLVTFSAMQAAFDYRDLLCGSFETISQLVMLAEQLPKHCKLASRSRICW
ncbi:hypothetical protein YO5_18107 [Stutzerimonas stutzeri TS44]|nr:hypothetical protein YO5_18107 [Stutzerimonas stutzeri TS44]